MLHEEHRVLRAAETEASLKGKMEYKTKNDVMRENFSQPPNFLKTKTLAFPQSSYRTIQRSLV